MGLQVGIASASLRSSTGTQDFTQSGIGTPVAYIVCATAATSDGTPLSDSVLSIGFCDGTTSRHMSIWSDNGVGTTDTKRYLSNNEVLNIPNGSGIYDAIVVTHDSFITDGVRLNVTTTDSTQVRVMVIMFSGSGVSADVGDALFSYGFASPSSVGFQSKLIFAMSPGSLLTSSWPTGTTSSAVYHTLGVAGYDGSTITQASVRRIGLNSQSSSSQFVQFDPNSILFSGNNVNVSNITSTSISWSGGGEESFVYLAIGGFSENVVVGTTTTPTSTGTTTISGLGIDPGALFIYSTLAKTTNTNISTTEASSISIGFGNSSIEASRGFTDVDGQATTDTVSLSNSSIIRTEDENGTDSNALIASIDNFGSGEFTLNFTSVDASNARYYIYAAIETDAGSTPKSGTGSLSLPVPTTSGTGSLTGNKSGSGSLSLPLPSISGTGEVGVKTGSGSLSLPLPTVSGIGEVGVKTGTGSLSLPLPSISGIGEVGVKTGTGSLSLPLITVSGTGEVGVKTGSGSLSLPLPSISGTGEVGVKTGSGSLSLPLPSISGIGEVGVKTGTGSLSLPLPTVSGIGEVGVKTGTGSLSLPLPTVSGTGEVGVKTGTGSLSLPLITVSGTGEVGVKTGSGSLSLPLPSISGVGEVGVKTGTGSLLLPLITVSGTGSLTGNKIGSGSLSLPLIIVSGTGSLTGNKIGSGSLSLPLPSISGIGEVGVKTGSGSLSLPLPTASGIGEVGVKSGTGSLSLPLPSISGIGEVGVKSGSGSLSLPLPSISGTGSLINDKIGTGSLSLSLPTVSGAGSLTGNRFGSGSLSLPLPIISGTGSLIGVKSGSGSLLLPLPGVSGNGDIVREFERVYRVINRSVLVIGPVDTVFNDPSAPVKPNYVIKGRNSSSAKYSSINVRRIKPEYDQ